MRLLLKILAGTVVALLGLPVLITYSVKNGIILPVIAFLLRNCRKITCADSVG